MDAKSIKNHQKIEVAFWAAFGERKAAKPSFSGSHVGRHFRPKLEKWHSKKDAKIDADFFL